MDNSINIMDSPSKKECWLTTTDNPFNPFTNFDEWYHYDVLLGYNTCGYLARVANISSSLVDVENERIINDAIDDILKYDPNPIYTKVWNDRPFNINTNKNEIVNDTNDVENNKQ